MKKKMKKSLILIGLFGSILLSGCNYNSYSEDSPNSTDDVQSSSNGSESEGSVPEGQDSNEKFKEIKYYIVDFESELDYGHQFARFTLKDGQKMFILRLPLDQVIIPKFTTQFDGGLWLTVRYQTESDLERIKSRKIEEQDSFEVELNNG